MAKITFKDIPVTTSGELPLVGSQSPDFLLVKRDLSDIQLSDFRGRKVLLNVFPSVDTGVCAMSVRKFNERAAALPNTVVLCVSKDLPFAHERFCAAEGIENVESVSTFRCDGFEKNFGLLMLDGPLKGLLARAVIVLDENGKVLYTQLVPEITHEPDYDLAIAALNA